MKDEWNFSGHGFRGWLRWGERKPIRPWFLDPMEADPLQVPEDGKLPDWATVPEDDEGEL